MILLKMPRVCVPVENNEGSLEWSRREVIRALTKMGTVRYLKEKKTKNKQYIRETDRQKYIRNRRKKSYLFIKIQGIELGETMATCTPKSL